MIIPVVRPRPAGAGEDPPTPEEAKPKYVEAFRDRPRIYPGPMPSEPGRPLVIPEGEFDALLLGQSPRGPGRRRDPGFGIEPARPRYHSGDAGRPRLVHRDRCR